MSKLVEIEAKLLPINGAVYVQLHGRGGREDSALHVVSESGGSTVAYFFVRTPHAAREYAQMLRGAADALLDWALTQEQPQNFAADWPAITPGEKAIEKIAAAEVPA